MNQTAHVDRVVILGANSKIAHEVAKLYAQEGAWLYLVGRDAGKLAAICADLRARSLRPERIHQEVRDLERCEEHAAIFARAQDAMDGVSVVLIAHGVLPDQALVREGGAQALASWNVNAISAGSLCLVAAKALRESQARSAVKEGFVLGVISSVASARGRAKNYVYGAAKAMLSHLAQGLRAELAPLGIRVLDIRPGFVKTPMTANLRQGALFANASDVAQVIRNGMTQKDGVLYAPGYWRWIMLILAHLPFAVFRRLPI